ncbi:hypothetical protein D3C81_1081040 [compost metagenome]
MLQQRAEAAGRDHDQYAGKRQNRTDQRTGGQALAETDDRHGQRHQRHQREDDAHVGRRGQGCGEVGEALIDRHAEYAKNENPAQIRTDLRPVRDYGFEHERGEQQTGEQPAVETDLGGENRPDRQFVDHGIAGPDKNRQQRKRVLHESKPVH